MSYLYEAEKLKLFTDEGQRQFIKIRDAVGDLISDAGAFKMEKVLTGDSWQALACVDRLVELGELYELKDPAIRCAQDRVFVAAQ